MTVYVGANDGLYRIDGQVRSLGPPDQGSVTSIVLDVRRPGRILVGTTQGGIFTTEDGGRLWQARNQGLQHLKVYSMAQHPLTGDIYAGTEPAAVFKSTDGGETWADSPHLQSLATTQAWTFPRPPHVAHVRDLAVCASEPRLLLGAVEEGWIIRSEDGGRTWDNVLEGVEFDSHSVAFMPDDPRIVIGTSGNGLSRSTDCGRTFQKVEAGLDRRYLSSVAVHPRRPQVLFVGAAETPPPFWHRRRQGANAAFYRSTDQGLSWVKLQEGLVAAPRAVAFDPADPDVVLFGMADGSIFASEDGGESFQVLARGLSPWIARIEVSNG